MNRKPSGHFNTRHSDDDDEPRRIDGRVKQRAENIAIREVGAAVDWPRFVEQAEGQVDWEGYEKWLAEQGWKPVAKYDYCGPDEQLLYQSIRFQYELFQSKKKFILRHHVGIGKWIHDGGPVRVPYNLPELSKRPDDPITLVEGEKGVDFLKGKGILASCVQGQNWSNDVVRPFAGRIVNIAMDNDDAGRENVKDAVEWLGKIGATIRVIRLPGLAPENGLDDWLASHEVAEYNEIVAETKAELPRYGKIIATPYQFPPEEDIARYDWLLGQHLLRGETSGTAAMGGTGKSNLANLEALSMASGKQLTHDVIPKPLRVVLINLEDSRNTMDKRIAAMMRAHGLTKDDIGDRLIVLAKGEVKINVATELRNGDVQKHDEVIDRLVELMQSHKADVLSIDSLIRSHSVNENFNGPMQKVIDCFEQIATRANCSVHLWHHTRKAGGDKATVESLRGAGSIVDAFRSVRILETMTKKEHDDARQINPDLKSPGHYFRVFNGKRNFAPPADESLWFEYASLKLRNHRSEFEDDGDSVGVIKRWRYPKVDLPKLTDGNVELILKAIKRGGPWRADLRAKNDWVGIPVAEALLLDLLKERKVVAKIIDQLERAGKLKRRRAKDTRTGKMREFIGVSDMR